MDKEIVIQYVNARNGNRPPSIKGDDGNYYTISDDAYESMLPWKGNAGQISYTTNAKGFHQATHWNGAVLPRGDQRRTPAATGIPQPQPKPVAPPTGPAKAVPFGYVAPHHEGALRTMPSVKEQFIMKVVEAYMHGETPIPDVAEMVAVITNAKAAWEQTMEAPDAPPQTISVRDSQDGMTPPWDNVPPPAGPDDYLAGG